MDPRRRSTTSVAAIIPRPTPSPGGRRDPCGSGKLVERPGRLMPTAAPNQPRPAQLPRAVTDITPLAFTTVPRIDIDAAIGAGELAARSCTAIDLTASAARSTTATTASGHRHGSGLRDGTNITGATNSTADDRHRGPTRSHVIRVCRDRHRCRRRANHFTSIEIRSRPRPSPDIAPAISNNTITGTAQEGQVLNRQRDRQRCRRGAELSVARADQRESWTNISGATNLDLSTVQREPDEDLTTRSGSTSARRIAMEPLPGRSFQRSQSSLPSPTSPSSLHHGRGVDHRQRRRKARVRPRSTARLNDADALGSPGAINGLRDGVNISGATSSTYTAHRGRRDLRDPASSRPPPMPTAG